MYSLLSKRKNIASKIKPNGTKRLGEKWHGLKVFEKLKCSVKWKINTGIENKESMFYFLKAFIKLGRLFAILPKKKRKSQSRNQKTKLPFPF
jgi:hypothetical protein